MSSGAGKPRSVCDCGDPGGVEAFDSERIATESRREAESDVFLQELEVVWHDKLDDARFESLIGELLERERGMHWLRQVGATREADDGRDFIAEWSVPPAGTSVDGVAEGIAPLYDRRHVMIQVKLRSRGVSRGDLPGLRDTLEHYQCSGLLVVAFPQVTTTLLDHLNELRRRGQFWVDWWGRTEIERRLRRYVRSVRELAQSVDLGSPADDLAKWSKWALAQADRVDPVLSREFLKYAQDE